MMLLLVNKAGVHHCNEMFQEQWMLAKRPSPGSLGGLHYLYSTICHEVEGASSGPKLNHRRGRGDIVRRQTALPSLQQNS